MKTHFSPLTPPHAVRVIIMTGGRATQHRTMKNSLAILRTIGVLALCGMALAPGKLGAQTATYQLDNGSITNNLNASDTTEPRDNWFANEFAALAGANVITRVDFGVFTTTSNSTASVVLYQIGTAHV